MLYEVYALQKKCYTMYTLGEFFNWLYLFAIDGHLTGQKMKIWLTNPKKENRYDSPSVFSGLLRCR